MSDEEELIGRVLRELPLQSAPPTLETRVMAEVARRSRLPWWRQGFAHWPLPARAGFVCVSLGLAAVGLFEGGWATAMLSSLHDIGWQSMPSMIAATALIKVWQTLVASAAHVVPAGWLYAAMAASTFLYAAVAGLGAVAFRTLRHNT
jgi:hypothetical protein